MDLWTSVPSAWRTGLSSVHSEIDTISARLEGSSSSFIPKSSQIFRALDLAPADVRVVIVGQDPYPNPAHACGLAFSVPPGTSPLPPTLANILREVVSDIGSTQVGNGDLQPWADQGVLLLNRTLTTESGTSNSHAGLGWATVTDAVISSVVATNPRVPAILWGAAAQKVADNFEASSVVASVHPSPLSAYRGFFGSKPFSAVNAILQQRQNSPIRW